MDIFSRQKRSEIMSKIRSTETKPEILVRKFLFSKGFRYSKNSKLLPGKPDVVLSKHKVVIFVNGCFWHGHKGCKYYSIPKTRTKWWVNKINRNRFNDNKNRRALKKQGWKTMTIWECELKPKKRENTFKKLIRSLNNIAK